MEVREGATYHDDVLFAALGAMYIPAKAGVEDIVGGQQLVCYGQVPPVPELLNKTTSQSFVLFH